MSGKHGDGDTECGEIAVYAAISSLSLSLIATGIDSIFDIGSNVFLIWVQRKREKLDTNKWPVGGARLETIGNIVYGLSSRASVHIRKLTRVKRAGFL